MANLNLLLNGDKYKSKTISDNFFRCFVDVITENDAISDVIEQDFACILVNSCIGLIEKKLPDYIVWDEKNGRIFSYDKSNKPYDFTEDEFEDLIKKAFEDIIKDADELFSRISR